MTDDNPRTEAASVITGHIFEGFENQKAVRLEHDRKSAIELAISISTKNDLILIAGKGHETWQEINGQKYHFSDLDIVQKTFGIHVSHKQYGEEVV